jgi:DNA adenine methylase
MAKSPLRYPGGKSKKSVQDLILSYMPAATEDFREAFCGGAGVFFGLDPKRVKKRWINDLNDGLIEVYLALRDRPDEFLALCRAILPPQPNEEEVSTKGTGKKYNKRLGELFNFFKYNEECDQALRYLFINRTVWAGRVTYNPDFESRMYYSNPNGWNMTTSNRLDECSKHLQGTRITNGDYADVINEPGENVWLYLDPPYVVDTEFNNGSKLYECGFTPEDHVRFVDTVKACKHKVCISYDNRADVKSWFKEEDGFYVHEHEWTYCGSSLKEKPVGKELIITNYVKEASHKDISLWEEFSH